jgi:hypothetical protein
MPHATAPSFQTHCHDAVQSLRAALIDLYHEIHADPASPRDVSRQLALHKNLTWKLGKILSADDSFDAVEHIPGPSGIRIFLDAAARAGAPEPAVAQVRAAYESFDEMVELHTGDRSNLELILDSMTTARDRLEKSRKLAFRGNSGIWGVQARVRLATHFLAPGAGDPSRLDYAQVGGIVDFQRLRPAASWPLLRLRGFNDDGSPAGASMSPICQDAMDPERPLLLPRFCSGAVPPVNVLHDDQGLIYQLDDGPVGRTGQFSAFFGYVDRDALTRFRDEHNRLGEVITIINTPLETVVLDLIVHRELAAQIAPEARVYGRASGMLDEHEEREERSLLPIHETLVRLGDGPPTVATPLVPSYRELASFAFDRLGWDPSEFTGWRFQASFPPMPSSVAIQFALPEAP